MARRSARRTRPDRPTGLIHHVRRRVGLMVRPNVRIVDPPDSVHMDRDVPVVVRDGTVLRANVFRDPAAGPRPVVLSAHPYGKDELPRPRRRGPGHRIPFQLRMLPQSEPFTISAWTSWEAPDPATWVPAGYAVVNLDLRGWGRSDGVGELLSAQEGRDVHDAVEWAASQPWCDGRVVMLGVSYLALSQWAAAAERPPHLAAICPWEGFTDAYRDVARRGGVREDGFLRLWTTTLRRQRRSPVRFLSESRRRPLIDDWWRARDRDIERIEVPALVCGSFSDQNLHSAGSFEGFRRIGSAQRHLSTHRGPKWATFYSAEAVAAQRAFFDHVLHGSPTTPPTVRLEVREDARTVTSVREEESWPPPGTTWDLLHLGGDGRLGHAPANPTTVAFDMRRGSARFTTRFDRDTELVGPMWVDLRVSVEGADDVALFVVVRKLRGGRVVGFEGSYGFDRAAVTVGMRRAAQRDPLDGDHPTWLHPCTETERRPLRDGEVADVTVDLAPSATLWRAGEELELAISGRWPYATNPLTGQFPAHYERSPRGTCRLHLGADGAGALHVPVRRPPQGGPVPSPGGGGARS